MVGFVSEVGGRDGLGSGDGDRAGLAFVPGMDDAGDGIAAGNVGEVTGLVRVDAGLWSGVGVKALGGSGLGAGLATGVGLTGGFDSGVTAGFGSEDGLKLGLVSGVGDIAVFVSCVDVTESLVSEDGLRAGASFFDSGVVAGLEGELRVSLGCSVAVVLASGVAVEVRTSASVLGADGASVSLSSGSPAVFSMPTPESLVSKFFSVILVSLAETSRP